MVGASGSSAERKSRQRLAPLAVPKCFWKSRRSSPQERSSPAALAEDPADERGGGDDVGGLPRVGALRTADRGVLAGHQRRVELGLGDVGVDPVDVGDRVVLDLLAAGAVEVVALVDLALEVGLGVGRDLPLHLVERAVARRAAGEGGQLRAAEVAQDVDEEQAVLAGHVADGAHRRRT